MSISLKSTENVSTDGIKVLVYGPPGAGKTVLCATAPNPVIISAESGLLSLRKSRLPYIEVKTFKELVEAYMWATTAKEAAQFGTICLDSLTEIGEVVLADLKTKNKDPRKAYGEVQEMMTNLIRDFRDMKGKNVYFSCKEETMRDGLTNAVTYRPMMPGTKLPEQIPYFFDEVFQMVAYTDPETKVTTRALRTQIDVGVYAKDRSGALEQWEHPDLSAIFNKIIHS